MITAKAPGKLYIAGEYAVVENGYPHYMLKEINEEPVVLEKTLKPYLENLDLWIMECNNIEYKDADEKTKHSDLCNAAILAIKGEILTDFLNRIDNKNASGEYYLTDTIKLDRKDGLLSSAG